MDLDLTIPADEGPALYYLGDDGTLRRLDGANFQWQAQDARETALCIGLLSYVLRHHFGSEPKPLPQT